MIDVPAHVSKPSSSSSSSLSSPSSYALTPPYRVIRSELPACRSNLGARIAQMPHTPLPSYTHALSALLRLLSDGEPSVRISAAQALAHMLEHRHLPAPHGVNLLMSVCGESAENDKGMRRVGVGTRGSGRDGVGGFNNRLGSEHDYPQPSRPNSRQHPHPLSAILRGVCVSATDYEVKCAGATLAYAIIMQAIRAVSATGVGAGPSGKRLSGQGQKGERETDSDTTREESLCLVSLCARSSAFFILREMVHDYDRVVRLQVSRLLLALTRTRVTQPSSAASPPSSLAQQFLCDLQSVVEWANALQPSLAARLQKDSREGVYGAQEDDYPASQCVQSTYDCY